MITRGKRKNKGKSRCKMNLSSLFTPDDIIEMMKIADSMLDKVIRGVISREIIKRTGIEAKKLGVMDLKTSAYRFLKLSPGCGKKVVKKAYREAIKELRPDLSAENKQEADFKQTKYMALQNARDMLLNIETKE